MIFSQIYFLKLQKFPSQSKKTFIVKKNNKKRNGQSLDDLSIHCVVYTEKRWLDDFPLHIYREANRCVYFMANKGRSQQESLRIYENNPSFLCQCFVWDARSIITTRHAVGQWRHRIVVRVCKCIPWHFKSKGKKKLYKCCIGVEHY